ncbi:MAG TPA: hypothetical protein PKD09_22745, partial [Aggregatilinea sp.]|uniref:hypothetical protein n=1 Tax=Aggregatilinea sp. TaxID=2806333 RepID=UPI002CBBCF0F
SGCSLAHSSCHYAVVKVRRSMSGRIEGTKTPNVFYNFGGGKAQRKREVFRLLLPVYAPLQSFIF